LWAREIAEELGEVLVLYFIDMAIAEVRMKSPPAAQDHKPRPKVIQVSPKETDISLQLWSTDTI
jgi:hypothetical protein